VQHSLLQERLRGVLGFLPTPFTADDRVDEDGLSAQVDYLCLNGVHVIVVCGGVGEFFSIDRAEFQACVRAAVVAAAGRAPVIAGVGHSTRLACQLAEDAAALGADGLMINPLYFIAPSEDGLIQHYRTLSRATPLGMIAFSNRDLVYTPRMLQQLAEIETVIALKDEYGDLKLFIESIELLGKRLRWINGMAEPLAAPYCAAGAEAMTSGIVNFAPQLTLAIWEAGEKGDWATLRSLVARSIRPLARLRERRKGYHIAVIKEAMNLLGLPGGAVRSPVLPLTPQDRDELRGALRNLELLTI
jgi:5-dehydro-4-deoxyglucarate dehydratase